ncbi:MAG: tRNA/rRNA methyltransferase [Yokenella regensburgei]|jgi:TrmH RNA methyltransferase|uniref:23S rRNA (Guanosine-2'-O-)-methyltransferase RlmB n=1 Tax=Yokenella regensburgei TaxID=158877 RepID=A0AB38FY49_9ENTR|nr:tRNA/rRNA methyltransferase [Yokenella regensburgei]KAF1366581.1 TrmH RNA methyltransferase [Yokenella regensburgei]KFD23697.1 putative tRNA/rRNA methyltransferase [Yokenella regensburgei ATCC 49455]MDQ4429020.1 tRNA/rRNA methyltransferase [Yokenella regensburgei]MDR2217458.1 tRNA/rRNA methyltransferase [Yokenella regensburgei]MDR3104485.1 tRNA/rRNA methyltransferase [Yokenella regensburgei]
MSDELKNKSGKVKVMYVRSDDDSDKRTQNPRTGKGGGRAGTSRTEGGRRPNREGKPAQPARERSRERNNDRGERGGDASPWRTVSRAPGDDAPAKPDHGGISGKSFIDPEVLRRQRAEETRVYGENACQALFLSRPDSIVRAWFIQSVTPRFKEALRWMAANRKAYHVVDDAELAKASGTEHHGGVCFLIKKRNGTTVQQWVSKAGEEDCVLALEDVGNPHNLGAMMRSCAHFGVKGVVVQDAALLESGAAIRTAEGGAEHVEPITGDSFIDTLSEFRNAGYTIVSTSSHKGTPLYQATLPKKMVLVLGQERDGLSEAAISSADLSVSIEGTGNVESLNVSVATGVLLGEWWRQNKA